MWVLIEFNVGTLVACMPSMVMFRRWVRGEYSVPKPAAAAAPVVAVPGEIVTIGGGGGRRRRVAGDELDLLTVSPVSDGDGTTVEMMEMGRGGEWVGVSVGEDIRVLETGRLPRGAA